MSFLNSENSIEFLTVKETADAFVEEKISLYGKISSFFILILIILFF